MLIHAVHVNRVVVSAAVDGGKLMGYFNLPWFAWGSAEMNLGDTVEYNTLVRVTSPYDRLATAIIKLFVYYRVRLTFYYTHAIRCRPDCTYVSDSLIILLSVTTTTSRPVILSGRAI